MDRSSIPSRLYSPLDGSKPEIRLLRVLPSEHDGAPLRCILSTATLSNKLVFTALSYVWGDAKDTGTILVNGTDFSATKTLADFLRQLRKLQMHSIPALKKFLFGPQQNVNQALATSAVASSLPLFWVDAICINQSDPRERSMQVSMMKSIYQRATLTFGWLGPEADASVNAMGVITAYGAEPADGGNGGAGAWLEEYSRKTGNFDPAWSISKAWDPVIRLLKRSYWQRLWIFQEMLLSKDMWLFCGSATCRLDDLMRVCMWIDSTPHDSSMSQLDPVLWSFVKGFCSYTSGYHTLNRVGDLRCYAPFTNIANPVMDADWKFFVIVGDLHTTDPRDRVYGLLGVMDLPIHPDYTKPVGSVFTEISRYGIDSGYLEVILSYSGLHEPDKSQREAWALPSWVPEWTNLHDSNGIGRVSSISEFSSSKHPLRRAFIKGDATLHLSGTLYDEVASIGETIEDKNFLAEVCHILGQLSSTTQYITGISKLQAILRVVLRNREPVSGRRLGNALRSLLILYRTLYLLIAMSGAKHEDGMDECLSLSELGMSYDSDFGSIDERFKRAILGTPEGSQLPETPPLKSAESAGIDFSTGVAKIYGLRLFQTKAGFLGVGPPMMLPGDLVCTVIGCQYPLVLRRDGAHYIHIGTSFVLGLMDGEGFKNQTGQGSRVESFDIH